MVQRETQELRIEGIKACLNCRELEAFNTGLRLAALLIGAVSNAVPDEMVAREDATHTQTKFATREKCPFVRTAALHAEADTPYLMLVTMAFVVSIASLLASAASACRHRDVMPMARYSATTAASSERISTSRPQR